MNIMPFQKTGDIRLATSCFCNVANLKSFLDFKFTCLKRSGLEEHEGSLGYAF
jgi:hypothetical protein